MSFLGPELHDAATKVAHLLKDREETVAVVETAAGGLISASLLAQPGASKYYKGGLTVYTLESRVAYVGWTNDDIKNYKGPTTEIVSKLAERTQATLKSTYVLAESGTAGPTGGNTTNRTPGYVALAVAGPSGTMERELNTGSANREKNMAAFATEALKLLHEQIQQKGRI